MSFRRPDRNRKTRNPKRASFPWSKNSLAGSFSPERRRALFIEPLEERRVLSVTLYVANSYFDVTSGTTTSTPAIGDTVNWLPTGQFAEVDNLTFGTNAFTSVQAAVNAATSGSTVNIAAGTYSDAVTVGVNSLTLRGAQFGIDANNASRGASESIMDTTTNSGETQFTIGANDVTVDGFTIQNETNTNHFGAAIFIQPGHHGTHVVNDIVKNNQIGLFLVNDSASDKAVVQHDLFASNNQPGPGGGTGIYLDQFTAGGAVTNVLIDSNTFKNNNNDGIVFSSTDNTKPTTNTTISNNVFDSNGGGLFMFDTTGAQITGNTVTGSLGSGITFGGGDSNDTVTANNISNNNTSNPSYVAAGIEVGNLQYGPVLANSNLSINYNNFGAQANGGYNLEVDPDPASLSPMTNPNVLGPAYSGGAKSLDAANNFWGTGVNTAAKVQVTILDPNNQVNFTPFLGGGAAVLSVVGGQPELIEPNGTIVSPPPASYTNNTGNPVTLVIDYSHGDPTPGGFTFTGGGSDALILTGYNTDLLTDTFSSAHAGNVQMTGYGTVHFSGLLPLTNSGTAADMVYNLPVATANNVTVGASPIPGDDRISGSVETTDFTNPTNSLTINLGNQGDTIAVYSMDNNFNPAGVAVAAPFMINGGTAADTVNVQSTADVLPGVGSYGRLLVDTAGGANTVNVGSASPALGGTLTNITSPLALQDTGGTNTLSIDDSGDATARPSATLTTGVAFLVGNFGEVTGLGNTAPIAYLISSTGPHNDTAGGVTIHAGSGGNTIDVTETNDAASAMTTTLDLGSAGDTADVEDTTPNNPLTVNGQANFNNVVVGSLGGKTLAGVLGNVNVTNTGGGTDVIVQDSGDTTAQTGVTISATRVSGFSPAIGTIDYSGAVLTNLEVFGGAPSAGHNTFTVTGTPQSGSGTTLDSGSASDVINVQGTNFTGFFVKDHAVGANTVNIGSTAPALGGTPGNINGTVQVSALGGRSNINVDDSGDASAQTVTVTNSGVTFTGYTPPNPLVSYDVGAANSLTVRGGTGPSNTFNITSVPIFAATTVDGNSGNDTFNVNFAGALPGGSTLNINGTAAGTNKLSVPSGDFVNPNGPNSGTVGADAGHPANVVTQYTGIQNLLGGPFTLNINTTSFPDIPSGNPDTEKLVRSGSQLQFYLNGTLEGSYNYASLSVVNLTGSSDNDTLTVDFSGGDPVPSGGINFDGATGTSNQLFVTGYSGVPVDSVYTGPHTGHVTVGAAAAITYKDLTPLFLTGTATDLTIGLTQTGVANPDVLVKASGTAGEDQISGSTFETTTFTNPSNSLTVVLGPHGDTITTQDMDAAFNPAGAGVVDPFTIYGDPGGNGDTYDIQSAEDAGGGSYGNATFGLGIVGNGNAVSAVNVGNATNGAQSIKSTLNIENPASPQSHNTIIVDDSADTTGRTATLSTLGSNPADSGTGLADIWGQIVGLAPAHINYEYLDTNGLTIDGGSGGNNFYVQATGTSPFAPYTTTINTGSGNDTVDVSSDAPTDTGSLANINGALNLNTGAGTDTLNISDLGGIAGTTYTLASAAGATTLTTTNPGFATPVAAITYDANGTSGQLENLNLVGSSAGGNTYDIHNTSATVHNTITDGNAAGTGGSTFNIQANALQGGATNTFNGNQNGNTFNVNYAANTSTSTAAGTTFVINAGTTGTSASRNVVNIDTTADTTARNLGFTYPAATGGDLNVTGLGTATHVTVTAAQEVNYFGPSFNTATVTGLGTGSILSVTPTTANSADVFLNGTPEILPPTSNTNNPGQVGGGGAPDLYLAGLDQATGLTVNGGGGTAQLVVNGSTEDSGGLANTSGWGGHQMSDGAYAGTGTFTPSTIRTAGNAYNTIDVSDAAVSISNNSVGPLLTTNIAAGSFGNPSATNPGLTVNAGDQAGVQANGVADDITATLSNTLHILVNGGNPTATNPGPLNGVPRGDQLNVFTPAEADVYSDNASPPHVSVNSLSQGTLPITYTSIERLNITPGNGIVNLIGDNNIPGNNQNDYFKVRGGPDPLNPVIFSDGIEQFSLQISGDWNPLTGAKDLSTPIYFSGVTRINAGGGAATSFDAVGNATFDSTDPAGVNALDITPYADNTPDGWGIETYWNQGNAHVAYGGTPDLLVYNAAPLTSENITVQPSASQAGQLTAVQSNTGMTDAVINYTNNSNIVVNGVTGAEGNIDNLFLNGTAPANGSTSGNEDFLANFGATAGTLVAPNVRVYDAGSPPPAARPIALESGDTAGILGTDLYNLQSFSNFNNIYFNTLGGNDLVNLISGRADGSLGVHVNTGAQGSSTTPFATTLLVDGAVGNNTFAVTPGTTNDSGSLSVTAAGATAATTVTFGHTQNIELVGGGGAAADTLTVNGTQGNDTFALTATAAGGGTAQVSAGPLVTFSNLGTTSTINLNGDSGSDTYIVNLIAGWFIPTVNINGSGSDTVEVFGDPTSADAFAYTPLSASAGTLSDIVNGVLPATTFHLTGIGSLSIDGNDVTTVNSLAFNVPLTDSYTITPGSDSASGTITVSSKGNNLLPLSFKRIQTVTPITNATAVVSAPAGGSITVGAGGLVTVANNSGITVNTYDFSGDTSASFALDLDLSAGNIAVTINQNTTGGTLFGGGINVLGGGPSANGNTLTINSNTAATNTILDFLASTIMDIVTGPISFLGIANLILNGDGDGASTFTVNNYGSPTDITSLTLNSNEGLFIHTDKIAVSTVAAGASTLYFTEQGGTNPLEFGALTRAEGGPAIKIAKFNSTPGDLTLSNPSDAISAVHVVLQDGTDGVTVSNSAGNTLVAGGVNIPVELVQNGGFPLSLWGSLVIDGGSSSATLTVDNSNGLVTLLPGGFGSGRIIFNGGSGGNNSLRLIGTTPVNSDVYTPGPGTGQGQDVESLGGVSQTVTFNNLTPVTDNAITTAAGQFVVNGTTGNDAITVANNTVSVNNLESITFANKFDLTVNGNGGNDTFNVSPASVVLTGGTPTINVAGTAGSNDLLTVNAVNAAGGTGFNPAAGTITNSGRTVAFSNMAAANIVGDGAGDTLTVTTPGTDTATVTPGAAVDAGSVTVASLTPLSFSRLGAAGGLTVADAAGTLVYNGTPGNDAFTVNQVAGTIGLVSQIGSQILVTTTASTLTLNDVAGQNTYAITGAAAPKFTTINVHGTGLTDPDSVTLTGDGASPVAVTMNADGTVTATGGGLGTVDVTGVATVNVSNAGNAVNVDDAGSNNTLVVTPTGPNADSAQLASGGQVINVTNATTFNAGVVLPGTNDSLTVDGTPQADTFTVTGALVTEANASFTNTVNFTGFKSLQVNGEDGSDTFNVTPSATIPIQVNGGSPIGVNPGDTLNVVAGGSPVKFYAGPTSDSGGFLVGADQPLSFTGIESIGSAATPITAPSVLILGTNGDDDIQVTAQAAGLSTVSVNGGPAVFYATPNILIDTLAGDDQTNITTPATAYNWDVNVFLAGVQHAAGSNNIDSLTVVTPLAPASGLTYTPSAVNADAGTLLYDQGGGNTSTITIGQFTDGAYTSSPGGVEQLALNGGAAGDALTVAAAAGSSFVYTPGATTDAATVAVNSELPLSFTNLGGAGSVNLNGTGASILTYNGTVNNDTFFVAANGAVTLNLQLPVSTTGIAFLTLNGESGDNSFAVTGGATLPYAGIGINGSGLSDPDVVNLFGDGASTVTVANLGGPAPFVTGGGLGIVSVTGVGTVKITNPGNSVEVDGTATADAFNVTPTTATTATIQANGISPIINATVAGVGNTLTIGGTANANAVTINGTPGNDTINTTLGSPTVVGIAGLLPINLTSADTQSLVLNGGAGNDIYNFSGGGILGSVANPGTISVGGGTGFFNTINLPTVAGPGQYIVAPGSDNASGFASSTGSPVIAFSGVRFINITGAGGANADLVAVDGTSGSDVDSVTPAGVGATNGTAQVNGGPLVTFTNLGTAATLALGTVNAPGGSDTFSFAQPAAGAIPTVNVSGGTNSSATITDPNASDVFTYTAATPTAGTVADSAGTTYNFGGMANLSVVGAFSNPLTSTLKVTNADAVVTPGTATGSGTVTASDTANNALLTLNYSNILSTSGAAGTLVVGSTVDNTTINVAANGDVTVTNNQFGTNIYHAGTYGDLVLNVSGNNTQVTIASGADFAAGGIQVMGTGTTSLVVNTTTSPTVNLATNQITGVVANAITVHGVSSVTVNGAAALTDTVNGYGAPTDIASLNLATEGKIALATSGTLNTFNFTSESPTAAKFTLATGGPAINITGFNNTPGNLTATGSAVNALNVIGSAGTNVFNVSTVPGFTRVLQTTGGTWVPLDLTGFKSLTIGGGDSDQLTVDDTNGQVTTPIFYNGGSGASTLTLAGTTLAQTDTYTPGPATGQGTDTMTFAVGGPQVVAFTNLTPVFDNVPGPLVVDGTSGNDAITAGATANVVTVNNLESITFSNKTSLTLVDPANPNNLGGNDTFNVTPANISNAGVAIPITVNGTPGAAHVLTVNATGAIGYNPTGSAAGSITNTGHSTVTFANVAAAAINGEAGNDTLTVTTPSADTTTLTPGATVDSGTVQSASLTPLSYSNLGATGGLTISDAGGTLVYNGTPANDTFTVDDTAGTIKLNSQILVTALASTLTLNDVAGENKYSISSVGAPAFATTNVHGSGLADPDSLTLTGNGTVPAVVTLNGDGTATVTGGGLGTVNVTGIANLTVDNTAGAGAGATVVDGAPNNTLDVAPIAGNSSTAQIAGEPLVVTTKSAGNLSVTVGTNDNVVVNGSQYQNTMNVTDSLVTDTETSGPATVLQSIALTGHTETTLVVNGGNSSDTFNVTPSLTVPIQVNGGSPIGVKPGDTLNIVGGGSITFYPGPHSDEGGFLVGTPLGIDQPLSFTGIESVGSIAAPIPGGPVLITGTNGDDDIQVTATAFQSYSVSVNAGPTMFFTSPTLYIDTLAGDDQTNITGPAAGSTYNWDENIFLAGVQHASGSNNIDSLTFETPTKGTLTYTPDTNASGPNDETGTLVYGQGGANNTTINIGPFTIANFPAPPTTFVSSPGGVEQLVVNGDSQIDPLTVMTPAALQGTQFDFTPGATTDAATVAIGSTLPLSFANLGLTTGVTLTDTGAAGKLLYNGTAANDAFLVTGAAGGNGSVTLKDSSGNNRQLPVTTSGITTLTLNDVTGENTYTVDAKDPLNGNPQPFTTINVNGSGLSDPDVLILNGDGTALAANFGGPNPTVTGGGLGTVNLTGVGTVNINANGGVLTVNDNLPDENLAVTPTGAQAGTFVVDGATPKFNFTNANISGLVANLTGNNGTLAINGATTAETFTATNTNVTVTGDIPVNYTAAQLAQLQINGLGGLNATSPTGNTLLVDSTAAAVVTPIVYSGGIGTGNSLQLTGGTATSDIYTPGPNGGQGNDTLLFGGTVAAPTGPRESVQFSLLTPVVDSVAGPLTVNGTTGNDAITAGATANVVTVNNLESITFSNKTSLTLDGNGGNDTFNITPSNLTLGGGAITVNGAVGANDTLNVNATGAIGYNPTGPAAGNITSTSNSTVSFVNVGAAAINGEAGNDTLTVTTPSADTTTLTPGATVDSGTVQSASLTPLSYSNLGATGGLTINDSGAGSTLVYNGTAANDSFTVDDTAGTIKLNSQITVSVPVATPPATLTLNGLAGDNTFTINGSAAAPVFAAVNVNGSGLSDPDVLTLKGGGAAVDANFAGANPFVKDGGLGTVTIAGVGTVNLNANGGILTVNDTLPNENLSVTPNGPTSGSFIVDSIAPVFNFTGANAVPGLVANLSNVAAGSTLAINGATTGETFTATNTSVTVTGDIPVDYTAAQLAQLAINGLGGLNATSAAGNTLIVNSAAAAVVTPIVYSGGIGTGNSLQLTGGTATSDSYQPGPNGGQGTDTLLFGGTVAAPLAPRESVQFSLLTPVFDSVAGPLTVNGTNAANAVNYMEGDDTTLTPNPVWGQVSVDGFEPINFTNKTTLTIDGLGGGDTINLNNPNTPTGLTAITVDGGNPTAGTANTLIVNGAAGAGPITYSPTAADGGKITGAGPVPVTLTHIQHLYLNDQGLGDKVTINGTVAGSDTFIHTPGSGNDAGTVAVNSLLALNYQNLSTAGSININETGPGTNTLVVQGTANNDAFGVAGGTGTVTLNSRVPITESGIQNLQLNGLSASDTFTLNATIPYANVAVNGANIANNDAVILNGATGAIAVNLADQAAIPPTLTTITGYNTGLGTVTLSDIAQASLNGTGAATLSVNGTPNDDVIKYTPTSPGGGNFSLTGLNTAFSFNIGAPAANTFTINGGGSTGGDQVNVYGPNAGSTFVADETARTVTVSNSAGNGLKAVTLGTGGTNEIQVVNLDAGIGNNTFLVAPARGIALGGSDHVGDPTFRVPSDLLVNVNGGGATSKNALVIGTNSGGTLAANLFAAVMRDTTDSGIIRMFQDSGTAEPIQYPDITYTGVGTVQTNTFDPAGDTTGAKQQTLVMGPDVYEPNQTLATAAYLGNGSAINVSNATIFPNSEEHQFVNANVDWFRVVAQYTGALDFQVYFTKQLFSTSDDALPGAGELNIDVYDSNSNLITSFGANDTNSDQRRRLPVVAGETYYLKVWGADPSGLGINGYNMSIVNTPAPTPNALGLNNVVAQGTVNNSIAPTTTTFAANNAPVPAPVIPPNFQTQPLPPLSSLDKFYVGLYLEFTSGALIGQRQLISGYTAATHTFTFSSPFSAAPSASDTFQIESDDTGRSQFDNVTRDNLPTIYIRLDAANSPNDGLIDLQGGGGTSQTPPNNVPIPIPFWPGNAATAPNSPANDGSYRIAVYDETDPNSPIFLGYANAVAGQTGVFQLQVTTPMSDGTHNLVAKVEMDSASTPSNHDVGASVSLSIVVDTQAPPVYFGSPTVPNTGLYGSSDTGVAGQPATLVDRITADSTPTFYGVAEADAIVRLYVDMNGDGKVDNGDVFIGQTVATPIDGSNQDPNGQWTLTSSLDLNNPKFGFPHDGVRTILATAEDVAGNVSAAQSLTIFLDTQGPQVGNVSVTGNPGYNLFLNKPNQPTRTPLVNALDVTFTDQPIRVGPDFVYPAVNPILATTVANYQLVGKNNGPVPITSVTFVDSTTSGTPGMSVATLHFASPLPDDLYTLTISDHIEDNAGNPLDGEFNGTTFPSGNNSPGGVFSGTFVVNSHPHIAVYSNGSVSLDINGNGVFDPSNTVIDSDLVETFGYPSDRLFSGNFASPTGFVSGFDELGAYGFVNNQWRWLLNLNPAQGTSNPTTFVEPFSIDALPVAGNFSGNPALGDQVGLFDGTTWWLDVLNHHTIDAADIAAGGELTGDMRGIPIVGDFDGSGKVSLATYQDGVFEFDLASKEPGGKLTGNYNATINVQSLIPNNIGFSGVLARPVAADLDQDGITDLGLYVPGQTENAPYGVAEWFWLISNDSKDAGGVNPSGAFASLNHPFNPTPLGHDLFYRYGNQFALPLIGIWDPPPSASTESNPPSSGWVDNLYQNVLGRQPSATEVSNWNTAISAGQMTDSQVAQTFLDSSERLSPIINNYYEQYLGRQADQAGLNYWISVWQANGGPEQVQAGIIGSPEYYATAGKLYPSLSPDAAWVTALYNNLLGRAPDPQGLSYWVNYIQTNSRQSVVLGFVTSSEYRLSLINGWFEEYLSRPADPSGAQYWLGQMEQGLTQDEMQVALLTSDEFVNKK
jgi:hypothetical protein